MSGLQHEPVLLEETVGLLNPRAGGVYVDATVGGGGHARRILEQAGPDARLVGIDRDEEAVGEAGTNLAGFGGSVMLVRGNFAELQAILSSLGLKGADGVLFDLGGSSFQFENPERGFGLAFTDAPLDMRMSRLENLRTAAEILAGSSERDLAEIIRRYGEERWASRIAQFILRERKRKPLTKVGDLVSIVKDAIPASARRSGGHPGRRTFQALRIAVNDELGALHKGLNQALRCLNPGGRVCAISFHSLEDKMVKDTFRASAEGCVCPPLFPVCVCSKTENYRLLTRKPVRPSELEVTRNPRARSARLRAVERVLMV